MSVKRVLIGAPVMPEFDRECGSRRIFDLIMLLREAGWAVSFVAANGRGGERYAHLLQQRGVAVYHGFGERIDRLLTRGRCRAEGHCRYYRRRLPSPMRTRPTHSPREPPSRTKSTRRSGLGSAAGALAPRATVPQISGGSQAGSASGLRMDQCRRWHPQDG